jgi:hypothetical protein
MLLKVNAEQLRKALADIEHAESNGFMYCEAVFKTKDIDKAFVNIEYSDIYEKAHPSDPSLSWGRFQGVAKISRFENGRLVPLTTVI